MVVRRFDDGTDELIPEDKGIRVVVTYANGAVRNRDYSSWARVPFDRITQSTVDAAPVPAPVAQIVFQNVDVVGQVVSARKVVGSAEPVAKS